MKITPVDINNQDFKKAFRGYDPVEVDTFLEMVSTEYEQLINLNKEMHHKLIQMEAELKNFKEVEKTMKQTLMNAQESSTKSRENSLKEAGLIKKEAEISAAELVDRAKREVYKMREEMVTLQTQKKSLLTRLRHILKSHIELLDVLEIDDADLSKLKDRTKVEFGKKPDSDKSRPNNPGKPDSAQDNMFNDIFSDNLNVDDTLK